MPAQSTLEIYSRLAAGERIRVKLETELRYDILRTELRRYHSVTRDLLSLSSDALCSSYKNGIGTFHIGIPARSSKLGLAVSYEVIKDA